MKIGDYILFNNIMFRIMDISGSFVDLRDLDSQNPGWIKGVPKSLVEQTCKIIPEESVNTDTMRLLYYR